MENLPSFDKLKDIVTDFDLSQYLDRRLVSVLALYGVAKVGYEALAVPSYGFWAHYVRPRMNLKKRFEGADWVVVTGASDGIGEALCHQFAKSGFNVVLVSRTQSKLDKVAKEVRELHGVQTVVVQTDFANLKTPEDAEALTRLMREKTKGLSVGILANNVGVLEFGAYHNTPLEKMFASFAVNIAAQSVMTHIFTSKWQEERKGKRCLVIDYSSVVGRKPMGGAPLYCGEKSYNAALSRSLGMQYANQYKADPVNKPNIEFMQVYPNSVKSGHMNPRGRLLFTVSSEAHAKAVVDQIGWTTDTRGACAHGVTNYVRRFWLIDWICTMENARRMSAGRSPGGDKKDAKEEKKAVIPTRVQKLTSGPFTQELIETAKKICAPGKGILAADESTGTIGKRFEQINVENNHANRQAYRELLFTTPGLAEYISGVIMFDETVRDTTKGGVKFTKVLRDRGIYSGIKVDTGLVNIGGTKDETITQGLDGLDKRCAEYYKLGCRFAKWRAVLKIGDGLPSKAAIEENAKQLARYGSICQANGLVPIIEPEILQDGEHSIDVCAAVSEKVFAAVMRELFAQHLLIEGLLLKPNMVTPGITCSTRATSRQIAEYTVRTLSRTMVPALPGVVFLSGGQSEEDATLNLHAMNIIQGVQKPWKLTFSYGRALQQSCLKAWQGKPENVRAAQWALLERAQANGAAALGKYPKGIQHMRKAFVGGNWKSNGDKAFANDFTKNQLNAFVSTQKLVEVVVAPTNLHLTTVQDLLTDNISVATQNISLTGKGAYTGELAAEQVADLGIKYTLTGHSERRQLQKESDEVVAKKTKAGLEKGLTVILCIGETLQEREAGKTDEVTSRQLMAVRKLVDAWSRIVVAYEPVWAIGTGKTATPDVAQAAHASIRAWLEENVSKDAAANVRVIYGGSVTEKNAAELIAQPDIDGFLVGGASLKPAFADIVNACQAHQEKQAKDVLGGGQSLFEANYKY